MSFDGVTTPVRQEVTRRVAMTSVSNPKAEAHAFLAQHFGVSKVKGKGEVDKCSHCKREGHTQEKCWELHPISDLRGIRLRR
jgi:hypothetical protein